MPNGQTFLERFGPRGVLRSSATYGESEITQEIEDTGPLNIETIGVLVRSSLPGTLWIAEVDSNIGMPPLKWSTNWDRYIPQFGGPLQWGHST